LLRLSKIFEVDAQVFRKNKPPPAEIRRRQTLISSHCWTSFSRLWNRNIDVSLGDAVRQSQALQRVLEDGRLRLDHNLSEGELRKVVRIRASSLDATNMPRPPGPFSR